MSCQPCGCDPEADHQCEFHRQHVEPYEVTEIVMGGSGLGTVFNTGGVRRLDHAAGCEGSSLIKDSGNPTIADQLKITYPYGHPSFLPITLKEIALHSDKNHDYAKGGEPLGNFTRVAKILALYPNLRLDDERIIALTYAMKQLDAVLWGMNSNIEAKVEGANQRLQDISVYVKLVMCMNEDRATLPKEIK